MATRQPPPESASPALADGLYIAVTQVYADAETAILATVTLNVRAALRSPVPGAELQSRSGTVITTTRATMTRAEGRARRIVPRVLAEAYGRGHGIERRVAEQALRNVLAQLGSLSGGVLRWVAGLWNRLTGAAYGPGDVRHAADRILQQAAGRGVTGYTDPSGRTWGLTSYVDQAVQHAAGGAAIDGFTGRLADEGDDLVIVTESPHPCPICSPWENKIISASGRDSRRPSMAEARAAGLFHPRCRHTIFRWHPGFTWPPNSLRNLPGTYEAEQRQRDIERNIRQWKRREAAALDDVTKAKAGAKVRSWQAELRRHLAAEGLQRSRQRERVDFGHTSPLKHAHG